MLCRLLSDRLPLRRATYANEPHPLKEILSEEGYTVTIAGTAEETLLLLRDASYDLMLLDIWLPDRDGLDLLKDVQALLPSNKPEVIIISGHGTIETAVRATKLGAYDFLEKPLSLDPDSQCA